MFSIYTNFIARFRTGDNINYNLKILKEMYIHLNNGVDFNKPIIIFLGAISEAILDDLFYRIKKYTIEGVEAISRKECDEIRSLENADSFFRYIEECQNYKILPNKLCGDLQRLRKLRNFIHIYLPKKKEENIWTDSKDRLHAEKTVEKLVKYVHLNYPRDEDKKYVSDFNFPWNESCPKITKKSLKKAKQKSKVKLNIKCEI